MMQRFAKAAAAFEAATLAKVNPPSAEQEELQRLSDDALIECLLLGDQ
jgi:hypothetical protein